MDREEPRSKFRSILTVILSLQKSPGILQGSPGILRGRLLGRALGLKSPLDIIRLVRSPLAGNSLDNNFRGSLPRRYSWAGPLTDGFLGGNGELPRFSRRL